MSGTENTLFLDCDGVLVSGQFKDTKSNSWSESDLRKNLNGGSFLEAEGVFTPLEKKAIQTSRKSSPGAMDGATDENALGFVSLDEKIFVLSDEEARNTAYGFWKSASYSPGRIKKNSLDKEAAWWLRTAFARNSRYVFGVSDSGGIDQNFQVTDTETGVSPAFNIDYSKIHHDSFRAKSAGAVSDSVYDRYDTGKC